MEDEGFAQLDKEVLEYEEEEGEGAGRGDKGNTDANLPHTVATTVHRPSPVPTGRNKLPQVKAGVQYQVAVFLGEEHSLVMSYCLHFTWARGESVSLFTTVPIEPMHLPQDVSVGVVSSHSNARLLGLLATAVPSLREGVQWLVLVPDTVYVHRPRLQEVLQSMDPEKDIFLGSGETHCSFQSGIVLSKALFTKLHKDLDSCGSKFSATEEDYEGDSILAQCVSAYGVKCSNGGKVCVMCTCVHTCVWVTHQCCGSGSSQMDSHKLCFMYEFHCNSCIPASAPGKKPLKTLVVKCSYNQLLGYSVRCI